MDCIKIEFKDADCDQKVANLNPKTQLVSNICIVQLKGMNVCNSVKVKQSTAEKRLHTHLYSKSNMF